MMSSVQSGSTRNRVVASRHRNARQRQEVAEAVSTVDRLVGDAQRPLVSQSASTWSALSKSNAVEAEGIRELNRHPSASLVLSVPQ